MKKTGSRWIALAAAFALLVPGALADTAYGAAGIETDRKDCTITFELNQDTYAGPEDDQVDYDMLNLGSLKIPVKLYKVADVDAGGRYKPVSLYASLTGLGSVDSETTAEAWAEFAEEAWAIAEPQSDEDGNIHSEGDIPFKEVVLEHARGTAEDLETGLYLVAAQKVITPEYTYAFTPYLISLPDNNYYEDDADTWLYDVTVGLKPSRENRYGDLEIVKTLDSYNATLGSATFIFRIEAEKEGIIFSDVVSLVFDSAGTRSVKLERKIPAGARVTVTEVYTGASYEVTSASEQTAIITAFDPDDPENAASVAFRNDYDERLNGGTSIVNHFRAEGSEDPAEQGADMPSERSNVVWDVEQLRDSAEQTGGEQL